MYFEDYVPGRVFTLEPIRVNVGEIITFAHEYDPQPMHTEPSSAEACALGGLIASGFQTCLLAMRSFVTGYISMESNLPAPGVDEIRWSAPMRPGEELAVRATVLDARPSQSKPDRGVVRSRLEAINANGIVVLSMCPINIMRRRPETIDPRHDPRAT
jgi:acyl dehydratase